MQALQCPQDCHMEGHPAAHIARTTIFSARVVWDQDILTKHLVRLHLGCLLGPGLYPEFSAMKQRAKSIKGCPPGLWRCLRLLRMCLYQPS